MLKKTILLMLSFVLLFSVSCAAPVQSDDEVAAGIVFRKIARERHSDGWVYTFEYQDFKDENADDSEMLKYTFYGINVRYTYDEDYIQKRVVYPEDNNPDGIFTEIIPPSVLVLGDGSPEEKADMDLIASLLSPDKRVEQLLALKPEDYEFKAVDKEMFFNLMHKALTGEPKKEGTKALYWDKPIYAVLCEPQFISNYKFQVICLHSTGFADVVCADILFKDTQSTTGYIQLSDMVENGTASPGQKQVFEKLIQITAAIEGTDNYLINADEYKELTIDGIDFNRLYVFFENIHNNNFARYSYTPETVTVKGIA